MNSVFSFDNMYLYKIQLFSSSGVSKEAEGTSPIEIDVKISRNLKLLFFFFKHFILFVALALPKKPN